MARLTSRSRLTATASALVVAYAATCVAALIGVLGPVQNAEEGALDLRFLYRGPTGDKPEEIVLVTVDEAADLPYWAPVPRAHLAAVIGTLDEAEARLVGLDFYLGERSFDAPGDSLLRQAIEDAGNVVPVSYLKHESGDAMREQRANPYFGDAALDYGYATFFTGTGVESVREGRVALGIDGQHALSLAGALYCHLRGIETGEVRNLPWSRRHPALPGHDNDYSRIIDYNGPPFQYYRSLDREMAGGIAAFHSHQVVTMPPPLAKRFFEGKTVLVGSGLSDAPDIYRTPFFSKAYDYEKTFGVEIHAQFLRTLLANDPLRRTGFFADAILFLLVSFLAAIVSVRLRPYWAMPLVLLVAIALWVLGFYLFVGHQLVVPLVRPSIAIGLACLGGLVYVGSTDGRRKGIARDRFAPMVGSEDLRRITEVPDAWGTDGEERVVSVLWARLDHGVGAGHPSARAAVLFYQSFWERLSAAVFEHGGTVFDYGDEGMGVVFGAPMGGRDHAQRAAAAAVQMAEVWISLQAGQGGEQRLAIGGGTGLGIVGELAGGERHAYRVLGRVVDEARACVERARGLDGVWFTAELADQVAEIVDAEAAVDGYARVRGRAKAPPIGRAEGRRSPFWKYLSLAKDEDDRISEELLRHLPLFSDFNQREVGRLRAQLYFRKFAAGEGVFGQGEVGSAMYIIQRGKVDILQEGEEGSEPKLLQRLGEGDFFGELALLSDLPRPAAAVVYEPAEILMLFQTDLFDLIEREPEFGVRLIRSLSRILGERLIQVNAALLEAAEAQR
jgi:CHASE2 domain-containing sensor protein/class 3 adenylate cyclase